LADQVTLKNGDRITGSVVKKDAKTLVVESKIIGTVTIPWEEVQTVSTEQPINIVLSGGDTVQGTLAPREQNVEIVGTQAKRQVPLSEISVLRNADEQHEYERRLSPGFADLWAGTASLGFAGAQGNAETSTLTATLDAARVTNSDKTTVYFKAVRASADLEGVSATTAQAVRGGWGYSRNVATRWFVNGFNDYEYDRFQNLDLRFVLGGGLGYIAWKGENGRLDLLGGGAYNRESFSPAAPAESFTRNSAEAYFGDDFTYTLASVTSLYQNARFFPNLSETGEYRFNFDTGLNTKLTSWLVWNLALSNRLLSNPIPGRKKNDILYSTGIGITFAR
jgi:putative salt-induced outer membrane protein YdiY